MKITPREYDEMNRRASPHSKLGKDCLWSFFVGGGNCLVGEVLRRAYLAKGFVLSDASAMTSVTLILISAVLTSLGWYQKLAARAGAGTLVPITGFANSVVSSAIEYRSEGFVPGVGAKMFVIAGPVVVYGLAASAVWGLVYHLLRPFI